MPLSLHARVVFPVDRPPIENGIVTIDGERIVAVGTCVEVANSIDLGDVALLPGFVNAHTHLEFSDLKKPLGQPGMRLVDWIRLVIAERGRGKYAPGRATKTGLEESCRCGVTSIADISWLEFLVYESTQISISTFHEVIGFSVARANSAFSALQLSLNALDVVLEMLPELRHGVSPHAPYTVSVQLLERLIDLARQRNEPVAMHLAESREELEFLADGSGPFQELLDERSMWDADAVPRGSRPLDYLRTLSTAPRALVIHGNYFDAEEKAFLAANADRMSLIYCPRTHAYFGHSPYPLAELLAAGVRVALGTDSRASNPDLSLLAEMRHVARGFPAIDPAVILRMGTLAGAEALGRDDDVGSITPGKLANLVAIPVDASSVNRPAAMLEEVLAERSEIKSVWLRGTNK